MKGNKSVPVIEAIDLKKYFRTRNGMLHAVDGVSLKVWEGSTLGVVGESGCGKTTLGRTVLGLLPATGGSILYRGRDLGSYSKSESRQARMKMQIIFQDPFSSLNPRMNVVDIIADPIRVNFPNKSKRERYARATELMDIVGLSARLQGAYPHELDGGRRQRIGVARALAVDPEFIVCDEPVSALDVSIRAQILNLLMDLQRDIGLTYMFITHDLSVVRHISQEIMVMYLGKCVEMAPADELFQNPLHPYTKALLTAIPLPTLESRGRTPELLQGEVSNPVDPPAACRFAPRCRYRTEACLKGEIPLREVLPGHHVACLAVGE